MAYCPNCGSEHIQLKKDTNVDWGRAVAGWAMFGVVGGAVGAVTGEDRNANACLDCGTSWRAADLYRILQTIKKLTGETLNLSLENHRKYMNNFIAEVGPYIEEIHLVEKKSEKLLGDIEEESAAKAMSGLGLGCLVSLGGCVAGASSGNLLIFLILILLPILVGYIIGMVIFVKDDDRVKKKQDNTRRKFERIKLEAKDKLEARLEYFISDHNL